ncbi:MAG: ethanolamine utilization protein [Proteobacteria bacterium]|nr:ethanolamine utilization protein [Pseudomonadota bacterium]
MFATRLAFVDLETTGMRAAADRITEVGIVTVDLAAGSDPAVERWSSLVDPEIPIPPEIQAMTGITDAMVRAAPTFSTLAAAIAARLADRVFVAHNARFDFGFLKHAFERTGRPFRARPLCTVKLSRRLEPDAEGHGLDAIIARHGLDVAHRHRALGDAEALWLFIQALYRLHDADAIARVAKGILRIPSLPSHLPPDLVDALPEAPGVYRFYGANALPLYIGKARNLRERVGAHFSSDWRSETDLRLSAEMTRLEYDVTAGEFGALLHEAAAVKAMLPAHNRALRRKADAGVLHWPEGTDVGELAFRVAADLDAQALGGDFGPFGSRRAAREHLRALATEHELCLTRLKLERRDGPCFARQLGRCRGACVGAEAATEHDARLRAALAPVAIPRWPFARAAAVVEQDGERVDIHVVRDWQWLGTAHDDDGVALLADVTRRDDPFDIDITRMLLRLYAKTPARFVPL